MEVSRNLRSANKLPARSLVVDSTRPVLTIHRRPAMESVGTLAESNEGWKILGADGRQNI